MPQIQFLEGVPTFGGQLGKALGTGLGSGFKESISAGITSALQKFKEEKARKEKNIGKLPGNFTFYQKNFGYADIPPGDKQELYKQAQELVAKGFSNDEALDNVFRAS